jgi:Fur family zinc uptake transcriptional regulator
MKDATAQHERSSEAQQLWLRRVDTICRERGVQITPLRRQILEILAKSEAPIGAYAVLDELSRVQNRPVAPPTVYRTLEFLVENGFIIKVASRNAFALCDTPGHDHHGILLICQRCGKSDEVESARLDALLLETAAAAGFRLQHQVVEIEGLCERCAEAA